MGPSSLKAAGALTVLAALVGWAWWSTGAAASIADDRTSAAHPATACPGASGSSAAPVDPAPKGLQQLVTVVVPGVALIDSTGRVLNARSNTGRAPQADDLIYVRVRDRYEVAGAALVARVAAAEWQAVGAPEECEPTHWLGYTD